MIGKRWKVEPVYVNGIPSYIVVDSDGHRKGVFDCEKWAQEMANELNMEEMNDRGRSERDH